MTGGEVRGFGTQGRRSSILGDHEDTVSRARAKLRDACSSTKPIPFWTTFGMKNYHHLINELDDDSTMNFTNFAQDNDTTFIGSNVTNEEIIHEVVSIAVPIIFGLVSLIGFVGNALVVVVVSANQQMRSTTNLLILNLAIADLLFIIFCVPFTATDYALRRWPFGHIWCKMVQYLIVVTAYASVYTLVFMSLDRFLAVVHPIASRSWRTERNAILAIFISWVLFLTVSIPVFISHGLVEFDDVHRHCIFLDSELFKDEFGYNLRAYRVRIFSVDIIKTL